MRQVLFLIVSTAFACAKASPSSGDGGTGGSDGGPTSDGGGGGIDADVCTAEPCSLLEQCGCGATQVCDLDRDDLPGGATRCRDVTAPGTELANCSSSTECAGGFGCLGATGFMQCRRYCDEEADCGEGGHCIIEVTYTDDGGQQQPVPGAVTCSKSCAIEAAADNGCPSDPQFGCRLFYEDPDGTAASGDEYFLSDCNRAPASGGGDDAACTSHSSCAPGYGCITFGASDKRCKQSCVYNVDGAAGPRVCAAGTCRQFSDNPMIGTTEYGYCD